VSGKRFSDLAIVRVDGLWCRHVPAFESDPDPFQRGADADGRWQVAANCGGFYLADEAPTAWAEWFRFLASAGFAPTQRLPRFMLHYQLDVAVVDLRTDTALDQVGLRRPDPDDDWEPFQRVGAELFAVGHAGIITTSAARPQSELICLFRGPGVTAPHGVTFDPPPELHEDAPVIPRGMRT
jgi:RES domain-containing protein